MREASLLRKRATWERKLGQVMGKVGAFKAGVAVKVLRLAW
jgi:hypothetical protein